jgi:hypothetical protein
LEIPKQKSIVVNSNDTGLRFSKMNKSFIMKTQLRKQHIFSKRRFKEGFLDSIESEVFKELSSKKLKKKYAMVLALQNNLELSQEDWEKLQFFKSIYFLILISISILILIYKIRKENIS